MNFNEIRVGAVLDIDGQPYQVHKTDFIKMQQSVPTLRAKMKNLITGAVLEKAFKPSTPVAEADLSRSKAQFMYREGDVFNFMMNDTYEQFTLELESVGNISNYVKEGEDVEVLNFNQKPVAVNLPPKVELKVVSAPPGVKGNSASGKITKRVTMETGLELDVPLFVKEGEIVRVNTQSGEYVERVN